VKTILPPAKVVHEPHDGCPFRISVTEDSRTKERSVNIENTGSGHWRLLSMPLDGSCPKATPMEPSPHVLRNAATMSEEQVLDRKRDLEDCHLCSDPDCAECKGKRVH
jgi:hypothetical protein